MIKYTSDIKLKIIQG